MLLLVFNPSGTIFFPSPFSSQVQPRGLRRVGWAPSAGQKARSLSKRASPSTLAAAAAGSVRREARKARGAAKTRRAAQRLTRAACFFFFTKRCLKSG